MTWSRVEVSPTGEVGVELAGRRVRIIRPDASLLIQGECKRWEPHGGGVLVAIASVVPEPDAPGLQDWEVVRAHRTLADRVTPPCAVYVGSRVEVEA